MLHASFMVFFEKSGKHYFLSIASNRIIYHVVTECLANLASLLAFSHPDTYCFFVISSLALCIIIINISFTIFRTHFSKGIQLDQIFS